MGDSAVLDLPSVLTRVQCGLSEKQAIPAILLMSVSSLLLELSLTRLFSVTLFYHFAFLAISVALLGLGAGGVFAYLKRDRLARWETRNLCAAICAINAVAIVLVLEIVLSIPISLYLDSSNLMRLSEIYFVTAVPFFFTGVAFAVVFARESARIGTLYAADLLGGSLACLAIVPALNFIGAPNCVLLAAVLMAVASLVWMGSARDQLGMLRYWPLVITIALAALLLANYSGKLIHLVYEKGKLTASRNIEFSHWNAISLIEVDSRKDGRWILIDADASTWIPNLPEESRREVGMSDPPSIANVLRPNGDFAIIGPGGGVDVLRALGSGSPHVTGIEINPLIANDIMRGRYAGYSYHLYTAPQVQIHVSDGRSWIRSSTQQFDVLQMTLVDTWASTAAGAFALTENNLYTVEAFEEYFNHLRPDAMICITRWEFKRPREALRVVSVAMEALHKQGVADLSRNFMVVSQPNGREDGIAVAVVAKKTPFTADEQRAVEAHLAAHTNLEPLYLPGANIENPFLDLIRSNDPHGFARGYEFNVAPVTDDSPFFFFTLKLDQMWEKGLKVFYWNLGVSMILALLVISTLAVSVFLVLPLALQRGQSARAKTKPLFYFIAIGLGYILVEIALIQRFVLFLGHPTYAVTVVIFLMLLASGAGSFVSRKWLREPSQARMPLLLIATGILVYLVALPKILGALVGLAFIVKLVLSFLLLTPLAFLMGMPFPAGIRAVSDERSSTVEWAWAMNAGSSVLGSVLAMVIAIQFGLTAALACGMAAYLAAMVLTQTLQNAHTQIA